MDRLVIDKDSDFSIHNVPFGVFSLNDNIKRVGAAYGDYVLDLWIMSRLAYFDELEIQTDVFENEYLNDFINLGKENTNAVRISLQRFLSDSTHPLWTLSDEFIYKLSDVTLHMPIKVGDYTDFYSSESHARNVGAMFRDPDNALLPNWKHMPIAYHGRASSIFVSGTDFKRPSGQTKPKDADLPVFTPTKRLDFELEIGAVIGKNSTWQEAVPVDEAEDYVFGYVLFNDWSARDIQGWEYVPLGPFLGKNFFSSISPWVVTSEALASYKTPAKKQDIEVLPYLKEKDGHQYDINLEVEYVTREGQRKTITRSNYKHLYWTIAQQVAHHTINGCNLNVGDILASGTISGDAPDSFGSLLELTWGGKNAIVFEDGSTRTFVEDGDEIILKGYGLKDGKRVGFGQLSNKVLSR